MKHKKTNDDRFTHGWWVANSWRAVAVMLFVLAAWMPAKAGLIEDRFSSAVFRAQVAGISKRSCVVEKDQSYYCWIGTRTELASLAEVHETTDQCLSKIPGFRKYYQAADWRTRYQGSVYGCWLTDIKYFQEAGLTQFNIFCSRRMR